MTGKQGIAELVTIYPGWYQGRTIHIHLKVHVAGASADETYSGGHSSHTGQLFLPEDVTADVARLNPYAGNSGVHRTLQSEDSIFLSQHGSAGIMQLNRLEKGSNQAGFTAVATLAIDPDATPPPIGMRGDRGRGPRPF